MNALPAASPTNARRVLALCITTLLVGAAFFLLEHDHGRSLKDLVDPDSGSIEVANNEGSLQRQIGCGMLFAVGLGCLFAARRKPVAARGLLATALLFCVAWCVASVVWSADVTLTIRRVGILVCFVAGAIGASRCFTLRELCLMCLGVSGGFLLIGLGDEILQGAFQPLAADYRFTGHVHPNLQASYCAAICMGSLCLIGRRQATRFVLLACAALGLAFLLLTKSRTASVAMIAGCAVIACFRLSRRQAVVAGVAGGFLLGVAVLAASVAGVDIEKTLAATILIGRTDDALSLTGRVPLWHQLIATVQDRLLNGFGVGAFWTPQHIHLASAVVGSGVTHAHSAYIETLLNVGIVGLAAYMLLALAATAEVLRRCRIQPEPGILFLAALILFGFVHGCAEALFVSASTVPFFAACGLLQVAFQARTIAASARGGAGVPASAGGGAGVPASAGSGASPFLQSFVAGGPSE